MRFGKKMALWAFCAVPAAAAMLTAGAGVASAAPIPPGPHHGPGHTSYCNPSQREQWDLNGGNTVNLTYSGSGFTYAVSLSQHGSCLGGTLTDTGLPAGHQTLTVRGIVLDNHVTFSVDYGHGSVQGSRTFTGDISRWGGVSGWWNKTGSEHGHSPWSLQHKAHPACWGHHGWYFNPRGCHV